MPFRINEDDFPAGRSDGLSLSDTVRSLIYLYKRLSGATSWRDEPTNNIKVLTDTVASVDLTAIQDDITNIQSSLTTTQETVAETESDVVNLDVFSESLYQRIVALEALVYPKVLWKYSEFVINPQPSLTAIASFTIPAGTLNRDNILIIDAAFGAGSAAGTRTVQITCGGIVIWAGTLSANAYAPVRKNISFDTLLSRPRTSATNNAGYTSTTTSGVFNFANFNLDVTFEIRASASSASMTVNIEHLLLQII
jgi:hypothetical protein